MHGTVYSGKVLPKNKEEKYMRSNGDFYVPLLENVSLTKRLLDKTAPEQNVSWF